MSQPPTSKDAFTAFSEEVKHLLLSWTIWRRLWNRDFEPHESVEKHIAAGDRAYQITGKVSKLLFTYLRWQVVRGVVLDLCRLCDAADTFGRSNLTLERVFADTDFSRSQALHDYALVYMTMAHEIVRDPTKVKGLRDKTIAHLDLDAATGRTAIADPDIHDIDLAVRSVVDFHHEVELARSTKSARDLGPHHWDQDVQAAKNGADRLVELLEAGLQES